MSRKDGSTCRFDEVNQYQSLLRRASAVSSQNEIAPLTRGLKKLVANRDLPQVWFALLGSFTLHPLVPYLTALVATRPAYRLIGVI